ncbi:unnamed protein product [Echinostoma caproni]|uniref:GNAT family N-acetyltransferase n=1 Tax=Echinostoma caproni TaxID=27848 RepID=A0A183AQ97_9TREM|nr:unnamed protein product [Echinostoma caproni]
MTSPDHKHSIDSEALWAHIRAPEFMPEDPKAFLALLEPRFYHRVTVSLPQAVARDPTGHAYQLQGYLHEYPCAQPVRNARRGTPLL